MRLFFPVTSPLMFTQSLTWDSAGHKHPKRHSQGKAQVDRQVLPVLLLARGHLGGGATSKQLQAREMKSCVSLIQQSGEDRSKQKPENGGDPDVMTPCSAAAFVSSSFFFLFYEPHFQRTCFMICAVNVHCPDRWETQTNITAHSRSLMSNMPPSLPPSLSILTQPPPASPSYSVCLVLRPKSFGYPLCGFKSCFKTKRVCPYFFSQTMSHT